MRAVAVYARISKDAEGRAEGVAVQERRCRKLAAELCPGHPVRVFVDNDISAADPNGRRPAYQEMVAAIRRGEIGALVTAEQSRLTRQPAELEELFTILAVAGIDAVHTYRGGRVEVAASKMISRILAAVDAEEVERLRARINDKLDALAVEGRPSGGRAYGYRRIVEADGRKNFEIIPGEADVARWAAEAVLSGWSLSNIARTLIERGAPTAKGGKWSATTVKAMLLAPTIAGHRVHRGKAVGQGTWEPILEEALSVRVT